MYKLKYGGTSCLPYSNSKVLCHSKNKMFPWTQPLRADSHMLILFAIGAGLNCNILAYLIATFALTLLYQTQGV